MLLHRGSICEPFTTAAKGVNQSTSVNESRQRRVIVPSHSLISPSDTALELFHAVQCHPARSDRSAAVLWLQSRRNNDGREPTSPVPRPHARTQSTAHFLCPSLPPSLALPHAPSLADSPGNMGAPASDHGWLERLISVMKAIIIDIALDLSLLSRRFQGARCQTI